MDAITGATTAVELHVPLSPGDVWALITDVARTGRHSPECVWAAWQPGSGPEPGGRFDARNRFPHGLETAVTCLVTEAEPERVFAWSVLDGDGRAGSQWRYDLNPDDGEAERPHDGGTLVRQRFTHGPGVTYLREHPEDLQPRLARIRANMLTTLGRMLGAGG